MDYYILSEFSEMFRIQNAFHKFLLITTDILLEDWVNSVWKTLSISFYEWVIKVNSHWLNYVRGWQNAWNRSCTSSDSLPCLPPHSLCMCYSFQREHLQERTKSFSSNVSGSKLGPCKSTKDRSTGEKDIKFYDVNILPGGVGGELHRKEVKAPKKHLGLRAYILFE